MITEKGIGAELRKLAASSKRTIEMSDGGQRGEGRLVLNIRATKAGPLCEWYAVWWRDERRRMRKLGGYPAVSIADARKVFRETYAPAISKGEDPEGPRERKARDEATVADMFGAYIETLTPGSSARETAQNILLGPVVDAEGRCKNGKKPICPGGAARAIGNRKRAADVTADDIIPHLSDIHARGSICQADGARSYIHSAFAWAIKSANSYKGPAAKKNWGIKFNPVAAIPADPDAKRVGERHLTPAQFRVFWAWLEEMDRLHVGAASLRIQMATGQRVTEILGILEPMYDRAESMLDWSRTKNGMPHAIPLPTQAVTILDGLSPNAAGLFFPNRLRPGQRATITSLDQLVGKFLGDTTFEVKVEHEKEHGAFAHFTPRDLRRTWKTLAGAAGLTKEIRDRIQNHARNDVSAKHYDRYDYLTEKRAAMATWEAYLERILRGDLDNPVAKLRAAAG